MATAVKMPALGQTSDELRLLSWYRDEGAEVVEGEPLFEAETDKTTLEVEAAASGTLLRLLCEPGESVVAGTVIAWIGGPGEELPDEEELTDKKEAPLDVLTPAAISSSESAADRRLAATPAARAVAREHGLELALLTGTGPGGRIERRDVEAAITAKPEAELVSKQRRAIASRLMRAAAVPQFTISRTIDARRALARVTETPGASLTHLLLQALAAALRLSPRLNRVWADDGPRYRSLNRCNVGLAIAADDNLIVATISEPDRVSLDELARTVRDVVEEARNGRLPAVASGPAAVTLSNLGMFGVDRFEAIVDPDQTAILAIGRVSERPAVCDAEVLAVPQLDLTLTVDHRTVDGADAARFLSLVCDHLQH